jgi:membrane protease YdiL (CAAX protease family)
MSKEYRLGRSKWGFYRRLMRPVRAVAIYLIAVFVGGGLLAPWLYWAANGTEILQSNPQPFHRFVTRSFLLIALLGLWPLAYYCRLDTWRAVGLKRERGWLKELGKGFLLGFASLGVVAAGAVLAGNRILFFGHELSTIGSALAMAAGTAIVVSFFEELLFRGVVFGALRQVYHWSIALLASSALFSVLHFFHKPVPSGDLTWSSGLQLLPAMMGGFVDPALVVPGFFVLLLAGAVLAAVYQRRGALFFSIGVHAGWIFWLKSYGVFTRNGPVPNQPLWGTVKMIDGWMACVVLLLTLLCVVWWRGVPQESASTTATLGNIEAARRVHRREGIAR